MIPHSDEIKDSDVSLEFPDIPVKNYFALIVNIRLRTPEDLENLILIENKSIMMKYWKDGELDSSYRDNLANVIIANLVKMDQKIQRKQFERLAFLISQLFSTERVDLWFNFSTKTYTGKLFSTYRTYRSKYMQMGPFEPFQLKRLHCAPYTQIADVLHEEVQRLEEKSTEKIIMCTTRNINTPDEAFQEFDATNDPISIKTEIILEPEALQQYETFEINEMETSEFATINYINLYTKDDLLTIINNENRGVMIKYQKYGALDNSYRDSLANLLISNIIKRNYKQK